MPSQTSIQPSHPILAGFREAFSHWKPVLMRARLEIFFLLVFAVAIHAHFYLARQGMPIESLPPEFQIISGFGLMTADLTISFILMLLIPLRIHDHINNRAHNTSLWHTLKRTAVPLTAEGLKALARILLWSLLFLIPGMVKQIRYSMIPYIVMFHPRYEKGEVNALELSEQIVKGLTLPLLLISLTELALSVAISWLPDEFSASTGDWILFTTLTRALTISLSIYTYSLFYSVYRQRAESCP